MIQITKVNIGIQEEEEVLKVLRSGGLAQGHVTAELESTFSKRFGGSDSIFVSNGTVAIMLALAALGVGPGDEVITTSFSFIGTIEPIIQLGAIPIFVDIERSSFNINTDLIKSRITKNTKAIIPVHLYGRPVNLEDLRSIANDYGIAILEDSCQAIGAQYAGEEIGTSGISVFSFYGSKNITCGEGGLISTSDSQLAEKIRLLRNHGSVQTYNHTLVGYNGRSTDLQASILNVQLGNLDNVTQGRQKNAAFFDQTINSIYIDTPMCNDDTYTSCYHQYTLKIKNPVHRNSFIEWMKLSDVETRIYYPYALSNHPLVVANGYGTTCSTAEEISACSVSIPVRESLSESEVKKISDSINNWNPVN